jgi:CubicO group peptidase (beta-lactamase class C family)
VMTFVDDGKLSLNDTIGKFLPMMAIHGKGNITIWECLSHLTAINGGNLKESRGMITQGSSMDAVMEKIAEQPMEGKPGKVFHYSSIGLQIAAAVIEKISGEDFKTLFREKIAIPCDMKNTDFGNGKIALAAGGAFSTPEDYIHFLQMILQNGYYNGRQVLSKESVVAMQKNYAKGATVAYSPAEAGSWGYGLGEWVMDNAVDRSEAVTSPGLFGSFPWVDNQRQYAGFLFVFNLKNKGRGDSYRQLKSIIDEQVGADSIH